MPKNKKKPVNWYSIIAFCLILFCLGWIIGVFLSTDESESHNRGDAFGGLTAPIIGFVSSVLIYLSFQAQIRANEKVQEQIDNGHQQTNFEFLLRELEYMKGLYHEASIQFKYSDYIGFHSLYFETAAFIKADNENPDKRYDTSYLENKFFVLNTFLLEMRYMMTLESTMNLSSEHRKIFRTKTWLFFTLKFSKSLENMLKLHIELSSGLSDQLDNAKESIQDLLTKMEEYKTESES